MLEQAGQPDPAVMSGALCQAAGARFRAGRGLDHGMFRRAIDLERGHPSRRLSDRADASYAALLKYADDLDEAETRLLALLAEARASGDLSSIAYSLAHLPQIALWRGGLAGPGSSPTSTSRSPSRAVWPRRRGRPASTRPGPGLRGTAR